MIIWIQSGDKITINILKILSESKGKSKNVSFGAQDSGDRDKQDAK